jgi:hypothetical protein
LGPTSKDFATAPLLLGFAGAIRRSELVGLDVTYLEFCAGGLRVSIRKSKTDQEALGARIAVAPGSTTCPVDAVRAWIRAAGISAGPLFRPAYADGKDLFAPAVSKSSRGVRESLRTPRWSESGRF